MALVHEETEHECLDAEIMVSQRQRGETIEDWNICHLEVEGMRRYTPDELVELGEWLIAQGKRIKSSYRKNGAPRTAGVLVGPTWEHCCPKRPPSAPKTVLPAADNCPACGAAPYAHGVGVGPAAPVCATCIGSGTVRPLYPHGTEYPCPDCTRGVAPSVAMGNRCGCNHWTKPTCPERNCPWKGKRPVDVPPERCEHGMRWDRQCSACTPGVAEAFGPSVTLSGEDAHFLAVRLRRLCTHHGYELPKFAADDASLINIAGSVIGALLTNAAAGAEIPREGEQ